MSAQNLPTPAFAAEQKYETLEVTPDSAEKYAVGRPEGSAAAQEKVEEDRKNSSNVDEGHGSAFKINVDWSAGSHGDTANDFRSRTGISQWNIIIGGWVFKYRVWFYTDQTYNYTFVDRSGDTYQCNVYSQGAHYVDFNSSNPDIVEIRGD